MELNRAGVFISLIMKIHMKGSCRTGSRMEEAYTNGNKAQLMTVNGTQVRWKINLQGIFLVTILP